MNTRAITDAKTSRHYVRQVWGGEVPVTPVSGVWADKQIQADQMGYLIKCAADGGRRFCVSKDMVCMDADSKRGINELMSQDTWPENVGKMRGVYLNKDGRLEHVRDALLYGAVGQMAKPSNNKTSRVPG